MRENLFRAVKVGEARGHLAPLVAGLLDGEHGEADCKGGEDHGVRAASASHN